MLGLKLRSEFQGRVLKGTAIELTNNNKTGAIQVPASQFLEITWPSFDLLKAIEAIGPDQGRPVVIIGERGQGKSHLMAALYHSLNDSGATAKWLGNWAERIGNSHAANLKLRQGMHVISESLHRQRYKYLWDLIFDNHPQGSFIRGKWEGKGDRKTDVPPAELILELLEKQPTALILDEFQTWYDGLTNTKQYPWKTWAFNFVQVLSEIASEHPELLVLVISVRNGTTDAYQQIHRVNPVQIDFKGPNSGSDRRRLLLHRLFENRIHLNEADIEKLLAVHLSEYFRLAEIGPTEQEKYRQEFIENWPFAPHLMRLLEDQVLVATDAQETRDLIRILADLFKHYGENSPILTAADFRIDSAESVIGSLLDSVSSKHHRDLREKAQRNLSSVLETVPNAKRDTPHLSELMGALWLRSLAVGNIAGAEPTTLQLDITRNRPIDDNAFQVELSTIIENSFNIHREGSRLVFRQEENPQAKLMAFAKNDKLFKDEEDLRYLAREIRFVLGGNEDVARAFRVIVLPRQWQSDPWGALEPSEHPNQWDARLPVIVLPEDPENRDERLGRWLRDHVQRQRNTLRYLLPKAGLNNCYFDRDLVVLARAAMKAKEWGTDPEYKRLHTIYQKSLRDLLKVRFDRFAVLSEWNYNEPKLCQFSLESIQAQGDKIPDAIEKAIQEDLFIPEDFEAFVLTLAGNNESLGKLLQELREPRPASEECIPWLGETTVKEKVIRLCARGKIAINREGMEYLQAQPGETEEDAWKRLRSKLGSGRQLDSTTLMLPQSVPQAHGATVITPPIGIPEPGNAPGNLIGQTTLSVPPSVAPSTSGSETQTTENPPLTGAMLFTETPNHKQTEYNAPATSALNLLGKTESWGIGPATKVTGLSLKVGSLSGAQLAKLLKHLPDGLTYELQLHKEESQ